MLRRSPAVPEKYRRNFRHLYFDIWWFGLVNGAFVAFSTVYLTRIGATPFQLGLYGAGPAVGALLFSLPFGWWLHRQQVDRTVFWSSILFRLFYLLWLPLPILFATAVQINVVLWATFIFSGPGTLLAIGFNAMFADVVPPAWRNHVLGIRQGLLAIASIVATLVCGYILESVIFPLNYQLVFGIGAFGAAMSTVHLWFIRTENRLPQAHQAEKPFRAQGNPEAFGGARDVRPPAVMRYFLRRGSYRLPRVEVLNGEYGRIMLIVFFFFLALYMPQPIFNPYWVGHLNYSDRLISIGTAVFYICQLLGSLQLARIGNRLGNRRTLALGAMLLCTYPGITALSPDPSAYLLASFLAGLAWGLAGGALLSYVLDIVPNDERPRYMAWYSLLTNLAILTGSMLGPQLAALLGLRLALGLTAVIRLFSGIIIWRFGFTANK